MRTEEFFARQCSTSMAVALENSTATEMPWTSLATATKSRAGNADHGLKRGRRATTVYLRDCALLAKSLPFSAL
jgi:hypothetical protein